MNGYEFTFPSVNDQVYPKYITALVVAPDKVDGATGAMLFSHGWGGNRFQHRDKMEITADAHNLVCVSVEYRMSGHDFDAERGLGFYIPYDLSFMQTFDTLNAFRRALDFYPDLDRSRLYAYGGSQGGHITLLSAIWAPATFRAVYTSSAMTCVDNKDALAGRAFAPWELSARNVIEHADAIGCPVIMEHGTADETVDHKIHAEPLERRLREGERAPVVRYYEGGSHSLEPAISKLEAYKILLPELLARPARGVADDFAAGATVTVPCGEKTLVIDWSRPTDSLDLFAWR